MQNQNLKLNQMYHVKGYSKPVKLLSYRSSTGMATIDDNGNQTGIKIDDIIGPVIDSLLSLLGRWLKSLFK